MPGKPGIFRVVGRILTFLCHKKASNMTVLDAFSYNLIYAYARVLTAFVRRETFLAALFL